MKAKAALVMISVFICSVMLAGAPVSAQEIGPADAQKNEEQAMAVMKRMADYLSQAKRFSVTLDTGFDAVQEFGQKIEFGETRKIVLSRPDHLRIDATKRDGSKSEFIFDGKEIALYFARENVYATEARPGTLDQAVEYFTNDLDMRLPLSELLSSKLGQVLTDKVREAAYVEKSYIAGIPCDHVAFRGDEADLQLWVAQGAKPLPQRVVITYTRIDGRPQFWAQFSNWNLAPVIPNSLFVFTPPAGAAKIVFAPKLMMRPGGNVTKEGK
ncbi:MAG: DUF2092 domain-containing protein [Deltaproteobacteria bacterium]|nr:DUF2092 domain-containing protein [Deltaproteobacteria bacterium]